MSELAVMALVMFAVGYVIGALTWPYFTQDLSASNDSSDNLQSKPSNQKAKTNT